ncbi:DUF4129 domain-containing protein [Gordonia amicalis]|uniref:DUF4129 domain-containing protein n=1 Tax=Gordonia amicalis TaxID=89053 RepID=A0AAE4R9L9_9ACTN|nr:DUF4129 domain-containing protein [Gordonia amicalis]MDV6312895.1 DUF4129 domain-containing protein [Gordonia amicalis]
MTPILAAPLDPGNEQARRWAEDELSQNAYQPPEPSWWDRFSDRVWGWIADNVLDLVGGSDTIRAIVIVIAILVALGLAVLVIRRVRRTPRVPKATENAAAKVVLSGSPRSAKELRAEAETRYAAGDYDTSVITAVRALAQRGIERGLLADEPSLTAHEVASELAFRFDEHGVELRSAADLFDAIAYGGRHAAAGSARAVLDLERTVSSARPAGVDTPGPRRLAVPR